jgi:hypothetical protein
MPFAEFIALLDEKGCKPSQLPNGQAIAFHHSPNDD